MQNADYKALAFGLSEQPMVELDNGVILQEDTARHFVALQKTARESGLALCAASGFRSYRAQLAIFDAKWAAQRPVLDDQDTVEALRLNGRGVVDAHPSILCTTRYITTSLGY